MSSVQQKPDKAANRGGVVKPSRQGTSKLTSKVTPVETSGLDGDIKEQQHYDSQSDNGKIRKQKTSKPHRIHMTEEERKQFMEIQNRQRNQIFNGSVSAAPHKAQNAENQAQELQLKCNLCKRNRPVFAGDDDIKRLPESALSKFLKVLRADTIKKMRYLQLLRISPKFISPCSCVNNYLHSYCLTAKIIQTRKIFCPRCDEHYQLHLSKHNVSIIGSVIRYVGIIGFVIATAASIVVLDGFLKCRQSGADDTRTFTSRHSLVGSDGSFLGFMEDCVDFGSLLRIQAIVLPIICWSLYYSLNYKKNVGTFQAIIEVLSVNDVKSVSRNEAKQNLHIIRENNARRKIENVLFDRFWYQNREEKQRRERMQKQRVVEENLRKSKEADQRHIDMKNQSFLSTNFGVRLKAAIVKMIKSKFEENKIQRLRAQIFQGGNKHGTTHDDTEGLRAEINVSPRLQKRINDQLEENDSISSAVFDNMMRNDTIRADVLRELAIAASKGKDGITEEAGIEEINDMAGTQYSGNTFLQRDTQTVVTVQSSNTLLQRNEGRIASLKQTSSSDFPHQINDLASHNSKLDINSQQMPQRIYNPSESNNGDINQQTKAHLTALDKKVKSSINQMMKEQRSLSVGSLPGNLKSHILKTMPHEQFLKNERLAMPSEDVYSDGLNKIRELPEEYEKQIKQDKALTQQDEQENRDIPVEASDEDSIDGADLPDHRFEEEKGDEPAGDKST